jgi:pimeloyl-ACP methyl ester carboxylesterase
MMNEMVTAGKIKQWLPYAYDWRKAPDEIVDDGLLSQTVSLANTSPTGKITIVAHSNGGLVAKMLGYKLEQIGRANIIDRVVLVAVPEFGTPQAIAGLLHGDGQALGKGLVLSQSTAREFGLNMIGAYDLLPSQNYFNRILDPVINIVNSINTAKTASGTSATSTTSISGYDTMRSFLSGLQPARQQASVGDTKAPAVLSADLLAVANRIHSWIDNWLFPTSTKVFSIAGWRRPTTKTIQYINGTMSKIFTGLGDGTVLTHIADRYNPIYFDQTSGTNANSKKDIVSHADILEAKSVRDIVSALIATSSTSTSASVTPELPAQLPQGISPQLPDLFMDSWMTIGVHSPVDIDVYDGLGGHVGLTPNPNPDSDLLFLDNTIPGAVYDTLGDEKYVVVPVTATSSYQVAFAGTGNGAFTFTLEQSVADKPLRSVTYTDMPVTPLFQGSTTITSLVNLVSPIIIASSTAPGGSILSFASTTPPILSLDFDGNGSVDATTTSHASIDPLLQLESLKVLVLGMNLSKNLEKDILNHIEKVRKIILKGDARELSRIQKILKGPASPRYNEREGHVVQGEHGERGRHWYFKKMTKDNRDELTSLTNVTLDAILPK